MSFKFLRFGQPFLVYPAAFLPRPRCQPLATLPMYERLVYRDVKILTADGVTLHCYLLRYSEQRNSVCDQISSPALTADMFQTSTAIASVIHTERCNVLLLSYRGYGTSYGIPSEKGTSLGGAVAVDLASRNPNQKLALILENTFTSLPEVVRDFPIRPSFWSFMLSGQRDTLVRKHHMERLWVAACTRNRE
ncbi:hydrolase-4 domain-containing protein [Favolaschia claudopus]|uniref:Hydrolase-4 domain-containing protein n=1 Tax=Favolaschia claudopus TaxID=2862362 RepID=A0AAV9ZWH4_9AGAR